MFRRNAALLSIGTIASQAILLLATPLLTRYFSPEAFGVFATFSAFYSVFAGVGTLRYELAIPAQRDVPLATFAGASAILASIIVVTCGIAGVLTIYFVVGVTIPGWVFILFPGMLLAAVYGVGVQWAARDRTFLRYTVSIILGPLVNVASSMSFALLGTADGNQLALSFMLGVLASVIVLIWPGEICNRMKDTFRILRQVRAVADTAIRLREFPKFALPTYAAATLSNALPVVILSLEFSQEHVGYYAVAMRFLLAPSALVGGAISEALRAELFSMQRDGIRVKTLIMRVARVGLSIAVPVIILAWLVGPDVLIFLVGRRFEYAGELVPYLAVGAALLVILQPLQAVFLVCGRQKLGLIAQLLLTIVPGAVMWMATTLLQSMSGVLLVYSLAIAVVGVIYLTAVFRVAEDSDQAVEKGQRH